jgi:hypothetical protein
LSSQALTAESTPPLRPTTTRRLTPVASDISEDAASTVSTELERELDMRPIVRQGMTARRLDRMVEPARVWPRLHPALPPGNYLAGYVVFCGARRSRSFRER